MLHAENAYYIPDVEINGRVCFTNFPSNTAFRGFGGPQAMAAIENIICEDRPARWASIALDVQRRNLYGVDERNITPYGQIVRHAITCRKSSTRSPNRATIANRRDEIEAQQRHRPLAAPRHRPHAA